MDIVLLTLILGSVIACYFYLTRNYHYWSNQNIPCIKGALPGLGHVWLMMRRGEHIGKFFQRIYEEFPDRSMVGLYNKTTPALLVREPKLIKTIMQTDFANFSKNLLKANPDLDPFLVANPFFSYGEKWSAARNSWTHVFSNAKLKILFARVEPICKKLENYLDQKLSQNEDTTEIKIDDIITKYVTEANTNVAYGVESFCFEDASHTLSLDKIADATLGLDFWPVLKEYIYFFMPELNKVLRISYFSKVLTNFICNATKLVQEDAHRGTIMRMILDQKRNNGEEYDENLLIDYAFGFFVAAYDTTKMTINFILYQLALHPHIQQRLRDEIKTVLAKYDGCLTYEALKEMSYMDQVISESQRLNTVVSILSKICTKKFELTGSDGLSCHVQPGMQIFVSTDGLHKDSKYWPDPDVFDPDRFAAHRKTEYEKFAFLPFGEGPRMCLGMKLALMQTKSCVATIIGKYTLELSPKTEVPLKIVGRKFVKSSRYIWFNVK